MLYLGSSWYPEQWPRDRWTRDIELMSRAGMNVVRIGDYAWARLEPHEGSYDLDWMHGAVEAAGQGGIKVVMCTPTDAPPAWMSQRYPDVLRTDESGNRVGHGARRHFSPTSPRYREFCRQIASTLGQRFGGHPNVIGWQIANEYVYPSYDPATLERFHQYLEQRYGSLDTLNQRWGTAYWSQTYTQWSQIPFPIGWHNPGLVLDHSRFVTQSFVEFQRDQIDSLREHISAQQWITHNGHPYDKIDWVAIGQDLDLASWDIYLGDMEMDPARLGWINDRCRSIKPRAHWVMETQPWHVNWASTHRTLPKGGFRTLIWHHLAHGAEAVLFWQWRAGLGGQEQYHGTVLGFDGEPGPAYPEIKRAGEEMKRVGNLFTNQRVKAPIAVVHGYPDRWALEGQRLGGFDVTEQLVSFYRPLRAAGYDVDVIDPGAPFDGYDLVIAPNLHLLSPDLIDRVEAYVLEGGHYLLGPRSGFKDEHNALLPSRQPGERLVKLLGAAVEGFYVPTQPVPINGPMGTGQASVLIEFLNPAENDAQAMLRYGASPEGWSRDRAAMVTRSTGKGRISYLGTHLDTRLMDALAAWACEQASVPKPVLSPPAGIAVTSRPGKDETFFIVINHNAHNATLDLPKAYVDELTGTRHEGSIEMPPLEIAVLRED